MGIFLVWICLSFSSAAEPSGVPSPVLSPSPVVLQTQSLLKQFQKAQKSELRALEHRQKMELKQLKSSHQAKDKEFRLKERDSFFKYRSEKHTGPEVREYVKQRRERHKLLRDSFAAEIEGRKKEQKAEAEKLKQEHSEKLKEFQTSLDQGVNPPDSLWPQAGR